MNPELIKRIRLLVSEGKVDDALGLFSDDWEDNDIIALKSRLKQLHDKRIRGILSNEQEQIETNLIVNDLLQWTDKSNEEKGKQQTTSIKVDTEVIALIKEKLTNSLKFYYLISAIPIFSAILLTVFFKIDDGISPIVGLGSAIISGLPIREILIRKDKISFLEVLLLKINNLKSKDEIEKVNHLAWGIIESALLKSQTNG